MKYCPICSETDVDEPMCWKEHKPPAECTEDGFTKTCSIVTNHFTGYALVTQKTLTAIMPVAVAKIVAWSGGTTESVVGSAAAVGLVALTCSALWSAAKYDSSLGPHVSFLKIHSASKKGTFATSACMCVCVRA